MGSRGFLLDDMHVIFEKLRTRYMRWMRWMRHARGVLNCGSSGALVPILQVHARATRPKQGHTHTHRVSSYRSIQG